MIKKLILASSLLVTSLMAEKNHTEFANKMLNTIPYGWNFNTTTCEDIEKEFKFQYYSNSNISATYSNYKRYKGVDVLCHVDDNLLEEIMLSSSKGGVDFFEPFQKYMSMDRAMRILRKYYNLEDIKIGNESYADYIKDYKVRLTKNVSLRLRFDRKKYAYGELIYIYLYRTPIYDLLLE
jgi:hypothetical protein